MNMKKKTKRKPQKKNNGKTRNHKKVLTFWQKRETAQDSIPFSEMYDDGLCDLGNDCWSATFAFSDINYSKTEGGEHIASFERYCKFLNAHDKTVSLQIHINNKPLSKTRIDLNLPIDASWEPEHKTIIREYNEIQRGRASGAKSHVQEKYVTIKITESSYETARSRIDQLNQTAISALRKCGCNTRRLDKMERLRLLREIYRPNDLTDIENYDRSVTGESDKDLIAPYEMELEGHGIIRLGDTYVKPYFLTEFPSTIDDDVIYRMTSMDEPVFVTINIHPLNPSETIESLRKQQRALDREKADNLRRQRKSGDPFPEVPRDLQKHIETIDSVLERLETRNEKLFVGNILFLLSGNTPEELELTEKRFQSRALETNCTMQSLHFATEEVFNSILPLGRDDAYQFIKRGFLTTEMAAFIPFNVVELVTPDGLIYGKNQLSNNFIMINRKKLANAHGFFFGGSGSGKSMGAKGEINETYHRTNDDIVIIDVDGEFTKLTKRLGGTVVDVKLSKSIQINPFDININYGADNDLDPVAVKSSFILSLIDTAVGKMDRITRSIADRVVQRIYAPWKRNPCDDTIPTFTDFYEELKKEPEQEAKELAISLEMYITGSLSIFAGKTNVEMNNRLICFNVQNLGNQLRLMGMSIIQDFIWNLVTRNQQEDKYTWLYNDEIHYSLRVPETAAWLAHCWKRGRKYGLIATGMTQQVEDVLKTAESKALIANSQFIMLYQQQASVLPDLANVVSLSEEQASYLLTCESGTGLLKAGSSVLQFDNTIPKNTLYYQTISTTVGEQNAG